MLLSYNLRNTLSRIIQYIYGVLKKSTKEMTSLLEHAKTTQKSGILNYLNVSVNLCKMAVAEMHLTSRIQHPLLASMSMEPG